MSSPVLQSVPCKTKKNRNSCEYPLQTKYGSAILCSLNSRSNELLEAWIGGWEKYWWGGGNFSHIAIQLAVSWNNTFHTSRSTAWGNENNWSYGSFCSLCEWFLWSNPFLCGMKSAQGSHTVRWNFRFTFRFRKTRHRDHQDLLYSLPEYNPGSKLGSASEKFFFYSLEHWNQILKHLWFPASYAIGDFIMLRASSYVCSSVFFRSTKG